MNWPYIVPHVPGSLFSFKRVLFCGLPNLTGSLVKRSSTMYNNLFRIPNKSYEVFLALIRYHFRSHIPYNLPTLNIKIRTDMKALRETKNHSNLGLLQKVNF